MPKLKCKCSNVIDLTPIPCQQKSLLILDKDTHDLYGSTPTIGDDLMKKLWKRAAQVFQCHECGRLMIFWKRDQTKPDVYQIECPDADPAVSP
jgi:hypothetical protein